ncbi:MULTISPECIES: TIGR03617 family F420-dependent LLM class oxidoreductase [unclassified Dietzia]|uniref:TIGR03617 family F420-dependent LLM class oxidoreductase n=1 Tax=unclassified Dietzia TaxID=2617939 RepID=UPI000D2081EF|nr:MULTISPECIES: TIGR03617 family F420-dependent LLM class oxidoreductase [unclassified Dietzia]AVZ40798.1 LLM class F420-dependent oxidoreductase [Dietzia sp. JS16-p6b]QGW26401.1 putative F420-dependent oxidoreductase [Dietzia sp. DQ12-45-1b]
MKVMTALFGPTDAVDRSAALREAGASGVFTFEGPHDVFTPLVLASQVRGLDVMSNVAIGFPRNPVQLAHQAYDLQLLSEGRFVLGLGTQVRAQIEKRYGTEFDHPVERMTELVGALRAVFATWETGERLDFRGEYYRHTLMTPTFVPGPNPYGPPPIYLGALGPRLTRATAQVADGLLVMPFGSTKFLRESTMPAVRAGLAAAGRREDDFEVVPEVIVSVAAGRDDDHVSTRRLLAFYGSTPAYKPVLDAHGWGDLQPELNAMSKQGRWQEMTSLISDEILHTIAACGTPAEVAAHIRDRVDGVSDRLCLYQTGPIATDALAEIVDALGGGR